MDQKMKRLENMLFKERLTTKRDFHKIFNKTYDRTRYEEKKEIRKEVPYIMKNIETGAPYKKPVPFSLFIQKNPILHTDPRDVPKPFVPQRDHMKEEIIRTRPRIILIPAISLDDITDPDIRKLMVSDIYKSTVLKTQGETATVAFQVREAPRAPLPVHMAPPNPIDLPKPQFRYVSPEWRMETLTWDARQQRANRDL